MLVISYLFNFEVGNMKRKFIGSYLLVLLIMLCTYVPFNLMHYSTIRNSITFVRRMGHAAIWYYFKDRGYIAAIDYKLLFIQIIIITMIFAIIYLFLPKRPSNLNMK
jgi:uncharacterized BrkB/YihY/UPF0761 family membrane protein